MESSFRYINQQNFYIETVGEDTEINIITQELVPHNLTTLPYVNIEKVLGRDTDLSLVNQILEESRKVILVNGLGGIGKTTLAKTLVQNKKKEYQHIVWINVLEDMKEAFVFNPVLMNNLFIDVEHISQDEHFVNRSFEIIINRLRQLEGNNLLIIDNAQSDIGIVENIEFISLEDNWNVLVTSRQSLEGFEVYELGYLNITDATALFYLHYSIETNDDLVIQIIEAIDYHTLAIEVIAKTAQTKGLGLNAIISELQAKGLSLASDTKMKLNYSNKKRVENIYAFILGAFEIAELSDFEQWILTQFSVLPSVYIHYQNNKGENILEFLQIENGKERDAFTNALNVIHAKGWLIWDDQSDAFKMHNILQEIINNIRKPKIENCSKLLDSMIKNLSFDDSENPYENSKYIKFGQSLMVNFKDEKHSDISGIAINLSEMFFEIGNYSESIKFNLLAVELEEKLSIENNDDLSIAYSNLALTYSEIEEMDLAIEYMEKSVRNREKMFDSEDLNIATSYNNLGEILRKAEDHQKALFYKEKAFNIRVAKLEENHLDLATSHNDLGITYLDLDKPTLGLKHLLQGINILEKQVSQDHHWLAISYNNISIAYIDLEEYGKAYSAISKALEIGIQVLDRHHPYLATFYLRLGIVCFNRNELKKAKEAISSSIRILALQKHNVVEEMEKAKEWKLKIEKSIMNTIAKSK